MCGRSRAVAPGPAFASRCAMQARTEPGSRGVAERNVYEPSGRYGSRRSVARAADASSPASRGINVAQAERAVSVIVGAGLLAYWARELSLRTSPAGLAGGALLYRGVSGHCHTYAALGINTARSDQEDSRPELDGVPNHVDVEQSITIGKPAAELWQLWRQPGVLGQIMGHFAEVETSSDGQTTWRIHGPLHQTPEYTTRIVEEREPELLSWRSEAGHGLALQGTLGFKPAPQDLGTELSLRVAFQPPGGSIGRAVVKLLGPAPKLFVQKALRRFKSLAETGQIPSLERNPAARNDGRDH
jgi:uncharacterized membrane protein